MSEKLLPCPFCGSDCERNAFNFDIATQRVAAGCVVYGCQVMGPLRKTEAEAITAWNTRPTPPDLEARIKEAADAAYAQGVENAEARASKRIAQLEQNVRILKSVDGIDPKATQYVDAVLKAVDRAEKAEAELASLRSQSTPPDLREAAGKALLLLGHYDAATSKAGEAADILRAALQPREQKKP